MEPRLSILTAAVSSFLFHGRPPDRVRLEWWPPRCSGHVEFRAYQPS